MVNSTVELIKFFNEFERRKFAFEGEKVNVKRKK